MNNESIALDSRNKTFKGMQKIAMSEQASGSDKRPDGLRQSVDGLRTLLMAQTRQIDVGIGELKWGKHPTGRMTRDVVPSMMHGVGVSCRSILLLTEQLASRRGIAFRLVTVLWRAYLISCIFFRLENMLPKRQIVTHGRRHSET